MNIIERIFDEDDNLNIEGRILYAEAMHLSKVADLPQKLIDYVWEDDENRLAVAELYELLDAKAVQKNPHVYFKKFMDTASLVSIDWNNLDAVLEDILRTALSSEHTPNRRMERRMALSLKTSNKTLRVSQPEKDAICVEQITFQFSEATPQPYRLLLQNAQGEEIEEFKVSTNKLQFQISIEDNDKYPTGLYYWTLLVGKTPISNRLYICTEEDARKMLF
ncbi:MAG: hypothetical protein AB8B69_23150 [Chitinophagales bacterium]